MAPEAALLSARRPWVEVAECSNWLGKLAAVKAGLGVMAIGRSFQRTTLDEMPKEAGLPALGALDYVVEGALDPDAAGGAFRAVPSEVAKRSASESDSN